MKKELWRRLYLQITLTFFLAEQRKLAVSDLLLLCASDARDITDNLMCQLRNIPVSIVCIDDHFSYSSKISSHPVLQSPVKSKLQVVFFSPKFLNFLDCKPEEAYSAFRNLDPFSTIAIFCGGLTEHDIMCYHITPLKSYNSWPKFEANNKSSKDLHIFPQHLLHRIQEIFPHNRSVVDDIVIVPEIINKVSYCI